MPGNRWVSSSRGPFIRSKIFKRNLIQSRTPKRQQSRSKMATAAISNEGQDSRFDGRPHLGQSQFDAGLHLCPHRCLVPLIAPAQADSLGFASVPTLSVRLLPFSGDLKARKSCENGQPRFLETPAPHRGVSKTQGLEPRAEVSALLNRGFPEV